MGKKEHNGVIPLNKILDRGKDIDFKIVSPVQQVLDRVRSEMNNNIPTKGDQLSVRHKRSLNVKKATPVNYAQKHLYIN